SLSRSAVVDEETARLLDERRAAIEAQQCQWSPWEETMGRLRQYAAELISGLTVDDPPLRPSGRPRV
ncbi:MAG: hypothetical protein LBL55_06535, partial [Propionibacteriaceae bacterium]|nr:hypothetical protein [Propionibacteriaceae bacterium]